jgi:hypothetical protein
MVKPISPVLADNLIRTARAFAAANASSLATVSRQIHGDPPFFDNLIAGKCSFTARKYDECMAQFEARWPAGIDRPPLQDHVHGKPAKPKERKSTNGKKSSKKSSVKTPHAPQVA